MSKYKRKSLKFYEMEFIFQFFAQLFSESELMGSVDNEVMNSEEGVLAEQDAMQAEGELATEEDGLMNIFEMVNFH